MYKLEWKQQNIGNFTIADTLYIDGKAVAYIHIVDGNHYALKMLIGAWQKEKEPFIATPINARKFALEYILNEVLTNIRFYTDLQNIIENEPERIYSYRMGYPPYDILNIAIATYEIGTIKREHYNGGQFASYCFMHKYEDLMPKENILDETKLREITINNRESKIYSDDWEELKQMALDFCAKVLYPGVLKMLTNVRDAITYETRGFSEKGGDK